MNQRNYQKELDRILAGLTESGRVPRLLLHSCCAPCSSYVMEYLSRYFEITVFYYNPNITEEAEYRRRAAEEARLIAQMPFSHPVTFLEGPYEPKRFLEAVRGLEQIPEGGARCRECFRLRLAESAKAAVQEGCDYFTTTLTISPLKNAAVLNELGEAAAAEYGTVFLPSDFKKRNGYKRSIELSHEYDLYRQDYCGCVFSKKEREAARKAAE